MLSFFSIFIFRLKRMNSNCISCNSENEIQSMDCKHFICEPCVDNMDDKKCPSCKLPFNLCSVCMTTIVLKEELLGCSHALCKNCMLKMNSKHCPCCRNEIKSEYFTEDVKNKIEEKIKSNKEKEVLEQNLRLRLVRDLSFLYHSVERDAIFAILDGFIQFISDYGIEGDENIDKILNKYVSFLHSSSELLFDVESVTFILSEFIGKYLDGLIDEIEDVQIVEEDITNQVMRDLLRSLSMINNFNASNQNGRTTVTTRFHIVGSDGQVIDGLTDEQDFISVVTRMLANNQQNLTNISNEISNIRHNVNQLNRMIEPEEEDDTNETEEDSNETEEDSNETEEDTNETEEESESEESEDDVIIIEPPVRTNQVVNVQNEQHSDGTTVRTITKKSNK